MKSIWDFISEERFSNEVIKSPPTEFAEVETMGMLSFSETLVNQCFGILMPNELMLGIVSSATADLFLSLHIKVYGPGSFSSQSAFEHSVLLIIHSLDGTMTENGLSLLFLIFLILFTASGIKALQPKP